MHGALLQLGIGVSQPTVATYMVRRHLRTIGGVRDGFHAPGATAVRWKPSMISRTDAVFSRHRRRAHLNCLGSTAPTEGLDDSDSVVGRSPSGTGAVPWLRTRSGRRRLTMSWKRSGRE